MRSKPPGPLGDSSGWCWWSGGKKGRTSGRSMAANRTRFPYFLFPQVDKLAGKVICDLYVRMYFFLFQFTSSFNVSSRKVLRKTIAIGVFDFFFSTSLIFILFLFLLKMWLIVFICFMNQTLVLVGQNYLSCYSPFLYFVNFHFYCLCFYQRCGLQEFILKLSWYASWTGL